MLHLKDDFESGAPITQVPSSWFNKVAKFINNLVGGEGVSITKNDDGNPSVIEVETESEISVGDITRTAPSSATNGIIGFTGTNTAASFAETTMGTNPTDNTTNTPGDTKRTYAAASVTFTEWEAYNSSDNGVKIKVYGILTGTTRAHYLSPFEIDIASNGLVKSIKALDNNSIAIYG